MVYELGRRGAHHVVSPVLAFPIGAEMRLSRFYPGT